MFQPFSNIQAREYANSVQLFQSVAAISHEERSQRGSMVWMRQKGREYLMRSSYNDRGRRTQKSLGPRGPETESLKARFEEARRRTAERRGTLNDRLAAQAALNRAAGMARMPNLSARILKALVRAGIDSTRLTVAGTHALYVYEAVAGGIFDSEPTTTEDIDLLVDPRAPLRFLVESELDDKRLIGALRLADRSFEVSAQVFRAVNRDGFLVDFIKPERADPWLNDALQTGEGDVSPAMIAGLQWLENAPRVEAVVIDTRGEPVSMKAPDPRVFAVHKYWISRQPGRERYKARRDLAQAKAVAAVLTEHLPHLRFEEAELRMVPRKLLSEAKSELEV